MTKIEQIALLVYNSYPNPYELSKARLVKIIYLSDWKFALEHGRQITDIKWYYNHYGPFVKSIIEEIRQSPYFETIKLTNSYGGEKEIFKPKDAFIEITLLEEEISVIQSIAKLSSQYFFDDFIRLVYSTYQVVVSEKYQYLDLVSLAKEYQQGQKMAA
jgi:hypothetical protein